MFVGISLILLSLLSSPSATVASLFVGLNIARPIDAVTKSRPAGLWFLGSARAFSSTVQGTFQY
jgi:hypothetical protein